ncbi:SDR family oxidoreductase [Pseudomonas silvicola]|nr:SDR family oxidoreductase [Pseudomonas silvicola]
MSQVLTTRQALVIGGTSGIGQATAIALRDAGSAVQVTGVSEREVIECQENPLMRGIEVACLDVSDAGAVAQLFRDLARLDVLVNAAGVGRGASEFSEEGFLRTLEINLTGTMRACYAAHPLLQQTGGCVVNLASMMSFFGSPTAPAYAASKGGVAQLTKSLALAWAAEGIRVNAVAPGWIDTPMTRGIQADEARNARVLARSPMRRWGRAQEVAAGIVFLCSPAASFINGVVLPIDGGYLACGI